MNIAATSLTGTSFFTKVDANNSRGVELDEFIANRPQGITEAQATAKFNELDTQQTGSLSASQLAQGNPRNANASGDTIALSDEALSLLLELSQASSSSPGAQRSGTEIFNTLDTDSNGTLSQEEFVSGRPGFASESDAVSEFSRLDADEDGSLTLEEIAEGNASSSTNSQAVAGPSGKPPPPPPPPSGSDSTDEIYDELDTNEDGVVDVNELMAGLAEEAEKESQTTEQSRNPLSALFSQAINAYTATANIEGLVDNTLLQTG